MVSVVTIAWLYVTKSTTNDEKEALNNTASVVGPVDGDEDVRSFSIVDTNQQKCYGDEGEINCPAKAASFYGQDAQYEGNLPSYKDNNDGTITDNVTGLMWQKASGDKMTYAEAVSKASNSGLAGYDDWRVPSIKELYSLMDFNGVDPDPTGASTSGLRPFLDTQVFDFQYGDTSAGSRIIDSQWVTSSKYISTVMNRQDKMLSDG